MRKNKNEIFHEISMRYWWTILFFHTDENHGKIWLFFGCRQKNLDLYRREKKEMLEAGVLDKVFLALSREPGIDKVNNEIDQLIGFSKLNPSAKMKEFIFIHFSHRFSDLRSTSHTSRSLTNLQYARTRARSLLRLWRLHNGWGRLPNSETNYSNSRPNAGPGSRGLHVDSEGKKKSIN